VAGRGGVARKRRECITAITLRQRIREGVWHVRSRAGWASASGCESGGGSALNPGRWLPCLPLQGSAGAPPDLLMCLLANSFYLLQAAVDARSG